MNQIQLIGNVGRAPEMSYTPNGVAVCKFSLATTRKVKDQQETTWHNIIAFNRAAEILNEYVAKGSKLFLQGTLTKRPYTAQDGTKREWVEVIVDRFEFVGSKLAHEVQDDDEVPPSNSTETDEVPF